MRYSSCKKDKALGTHMENCTYYRPSINTDNNAIEKRTRLESGIETFKDPIHFSMRFCVLKVLFYIASFFSLHRYAPLYWMRKHHSSMYENSIDNYPSCMDMSLDHGLCNAYTWWWMQLKWWSFFANTFVDNLTRQWKWQSIFLFSKTNRIKHFAADTFEPYFVKKEWQKINAIKLFKAPI